VTTSSVGNSSGTCTDGLPVTSSAAVVPPGGVVSTGVVSTGVVSIGVVSSGNVFAGVVESVSNRSDAVSSSPENAPPIHAMNTTAPMARTPASVHRRKFRLMVEVRSTFASSMRRCWRLAF
jgi:hypothetical protein